LGQKNICSTTIDLPETEICVWTTIFELYLIHADLNQLEGGRVAQAALLGKLLDDRVLRLTTVKTYFRLAESDIPLIKDLRLLLSTWKKNYVSRDLSDLLSNYLITVWD
jgi:hypothetical protein